MSLTHSLEILTYIVVDTPANRGKLNDNALFATKNLIIPLRPESGWESGITQTNKRLIKEAQQYFDLQLLALVPTDLSERLDQDTRDRNLLCDKQSGRARAVRAKLCPIDVFRLGRH